MKKVIWLLLLATLLACSPTTTETQPASTDEEEDNAVASVDTNDEAESEPSAPAAADLAAFTPANSVEEAAVVRAQDWQKGATDPIVVLIEYSDFQ